MLKIKNGLVFSREHGFRKIDVLVKGKRIAKTGTGLSEPVMQTIDAEGFYVVPGFIDIHTHGGKGFDVMTAAYDDLAQLSLYYASQGVTSFLPTTVTLPVLRIVKAIENIVSAMERGMPGAAILGINLEGPFLNRRYKGSHPEEYIIHPSAELIESLVNKSKNSIRMITIAPELEGVDDIVRCFVQEGIVFSIGHSALNNVEAYKAFDNGITHVTHLFNSMPGMHHREPGLAGAALDRDDVTVEIIADGVHINPSIIRMVVKCKSPEKVALISDSTMAAGLGDGEYLFAGEHPAYVKNGEARLKNGILTGSTISMVEAVRNMAVKFGIPLEQALVMASYTPARVLKIDDRKGNICEGMDADLVLLDKDLNVRMTLVEGRVVFKN